MQLHRISSSRGDSFADVSVKGDVHYTGTIFTFRYRCQYCDVIITHTLKTLFLACEAGGFVRAGSKVLAFLSRLPRQDF